MITDRHASYVFPFVIYLLPPIAVIAPNGVVPLGAVGAAIFLLSDTVRRRFWARFRTPLAAGLIALLAWQAIASIWSFEPAESLFLVFRISLIFGGGLLYLAAMDGLDGDGQRRASTALAWAGPIYLALLGSELVTDGFLNKLAQGIPLSEPFNFNYINRTSVILAILAWPLALAVWHRVGGVIAVVFLLLVFIWIWHVPILASIVAFVGAGLVFAFGYAWPRGTVAVVGLVLLFVVVLGPPAATLGFTDTSYVGELKSLAERIPGTASSAQHRLLIAEFVLERIAEHPWLGWGFDASRGMRAGMFEEIVKGSRIPLHPHNAALQIWLELGAVGILVVAALMVHVLRSIPRIAVTRRGAALAAACFTCYATIALLSFGIWQNWWLVTAWFAAILMVLPMKEERVSEPSLSPDDLLQSGATDLVPPSPPHPPSDRP